MHTVPRIHQAVIPILVALCLSGCATTKTSNTARTATEQLLLSNAIDQSLMKVDFAAMQGRRVFLEGDYLEGVDKQYVLASLRHHLLYNGASLAEAADSADVILEPRSGGIGTDTTESYYGVPEISLPGGVFTSPEIKLVTRLTQHATAKIGLVAYDAGERSIVGGGGVSIAQASHVNWHVLGVGPFTTGSIQEELASATSGVPYNRTDDLPRTVAFGTGIPRPLETYGTDPPGLVAPALPSLTAPTIRQAGHAIR